MPYDKSNAKLEALLKQVLDDPTDLEIKTGAENANLEFQDMLEAITENAEVEVWGVVSSEISSYNAAETRIEAEATNVASLLRPDPGYPDYFYPSELWYASPLLIGIFVVVFGAIWMAITGWTRFLTFFRSGIPFWLAAIGGSLLLASAGIYGVLTLIDSIKRRAFNNKFAALQTARHEAEENVGLPSLRTQLQNTLTEIDRALIEKKIKPKLRKLINKVLKPSYSVTFNIIGASGLAEVFDPSQAVDTAAKQRLKFMLESIPGGSIGIAGPRGAGKSTMILSYCGPKPVVERLSKPGSLPILSVFASAPVEYQSRDFILYLFSAVCRQVLERLGEPYDQSILHDTNNERQETVATVSRFLYPLSMGLYYLGGLLLVLGFLLAWAFSQYPTPQQPSSSERAETQVVTAQPSSKPGPDQQKAAEPGFIRFLKALDIKPGFLLSWGLFFCLLGMLSLVIRRFRRPIGRPVAPFDLPRITSSGSKTDEEKHEKETHDFLILESKKWLKNIKFQQSYTSGWSGAFKLPIGLEGGLSNAVTFAENQLSLPEVVHSFTKFISQLSTHYQVIIGIDELDKIESDDKAQKFLNEIKSIFGLERCFYLISVSENAMSNFERRGLPFRDVFDSSFDSIIYVDYLNFAGAKRLLSERVTGKPMPFFALSYCLSGGLARDLIRNFRGILEVSESLGPDDEPLGKDLASLCQALVREDLRAKIRAVSVAAKRIQLEPDAGSFLDKVYQLDRDPLTATHLLTSIPSLMFATQPGNSDKQVAKKHEQLLNLKRELTVYCYYLVTLLEFFNNQLIRGKLKPIELPGSGLDQLAHARQVLAVDPRITKKLIDKFREEQNLSALPGLPIAPVSVPALTIDCIT